MNIPNTLGIHNFERQWNLLSWQYVVILVLTFRATKFHDERVNFAVISHKRSDLYFTVSDDERKALAAVQRIDRVIASKIQKQSSDSSRDSLVDRKEKSLHRTTANKT